MSLVLWSGGLDSTLILHTLATEARDGVRHHPHSVRALTITQSQLGVHQPSADAARDKVKKAFRAAGLIVNYLDVTLSHGHTGKRSEQFIGSSDNPQLLLWLSLAVNYLEPDEDLYAGHIRGDDAWHRIGHLWAAFNGLQGLAGHTGTMQFPLEWKRKADVIRETKALDLYRLCWWCEELDPPKSHGRRVPCGKCNSCVTNDTGLWQLEREAKT